MVHALRTHWPEYLMEAAGLGLFMISAGLFGTLLEFPKSPVHVALPDPLVRRLLMGLAMGATAIGLIYYPWGQRCGAHYNPAVTLTFLRLGRIQAVDAVWYVIAQFAGGTLGVLLVNLLLGKAFADAPVSFVATVPGRSGVSAALIGEFLISLFLMLMVLMTVDSMRLMRWTGILSGVLIALYITLEAPLSGMSMNPARTFASAFPGGPWTAWWVYFIAPPIAMLISVDLSRLITRSASAGCAKLNHHTRRRCIFCGFGAHDSAQ